MDEWVLIDRYIGELMDEWVIDRYMVEGQTDRYIRNHKY